jgi:L-lactate dehydrogenase (cytochrome)
VIAASIDDLREMARRRLPRPLFDYIDGGAGSEETVRANRRDLDRITLNQRLMVDTSRRTLATTVLGTPLALPLILGPVGSAGVFSRRGEAAAARAAERCGITLCLSNASVCSVEEVRAARQTPFWMQLYMNKDRDDSVQLVRRAQAAGCSALVFTVDSQLNGKRDRDVRNGRGGADFASIPSITVRNLFDMLTRIRWMADMAQAGRVTFGNYAQPGRGKFLPLARMLARQQDASVSWKEVEWVRSLWKGPYLIKGIMTVHDAMRSLDSGADGVVVSNHGGRQLDGAPSAISVLPAIAEAVKKRGSAVLFDSGIRRGQDIVRALALGAEACLIGRAYAYGLGAQGEAGVYRAIRILEHEMSFTLAQLGCNSVAELDRSAVTL